MKSIEALILEIDHEWTLPIEEKVHLKILGAGALLLQVGYGGGTKDSDILETTSLTPEIKAHLLELAGPETELATRHRTYVEIVGSGIPFLRQKAVWHPQTAVNGQLENLHIEALDVVDVVVSKLKRLSPSDIEHIEAMFDRDLVQHEALVSCFEEAVDYFGTDARADDLPLYRANLHRIERDVYGVGPTAIALPPWVEDD